MTDDKPRKNSELLWIIWQDAVGGDRIHRDDIATSKLAVNTNLGWIEHENDDRVVLCHGFGNTGEHEHTTIPTGDILQRIPVQKRRAKQC